MEFRFPTSRPLVFFPAGSTTIMRPRRPMKQVAPILDWSSIGQSVYV